jgi:hypothetical protein
MVGIMLIHGTIETVHELVEPGLGNYRSRQSIICQFFFQHYLQQVSCTFKNYLIKC